MLNPTQPCFLKGCFSAHECRQIVSHQNQLIPFTEILPYLPQMPKNPSYGGGFIQPQSDTLWIFMRVMAILQQANQQFYQFEIDDLAGIQLSIFPEGSELNWHHHIGLGSLSSRKLAFLMHLSNPSHYQGGEVDIKGWGIDDWQLEPDQGNACILPVYMHSRIRRITQGQMFLLQAWAKGSHCFT